MKIDLSKVSYLQKGSGKDLVCLHGYLSSKEAFYHQVAYFSRFFRVTAIDFLGFGHTMSLTSAFSVDDYATWTKEVLKELGVQKPHVIAHSFGCRVAVKLASRESDFFDKMILTGAAGVRPKHGVAYHTKVFLYRIARRIAPAFAEKNFGSAEYRTLSPIMRESYKKIVNEDLVECARRIQNQVLIVQGEEDTVTPISDVNAYLGALQHGKLVQISGGHFAFLEYPTAFNLLVEGFIHE